MKRFLRVKRLMAEDRNSRAPPATKNKSNDVSISRPDITKPTTAPIFAKKKMMPVPMLGWTRSTVTISENMAGLTKAVPKEKIRASNNI